MNSKQALFALCLLLLPVPSVGQTPPLQFCQKGALCWTDDSGGTNQTELKLLSAGPVISVILPPGVTTYSFAERFRASTSLWICGQARGIKPDGTKTGWYISETEGVCNQLAQVMPPLIPPVEPPVEPPDEPEEPAEPVFIIEEHGVVVILKYLAADCPNGVTKSTKGTTTKTITLTCRK